MLRQNASKLVDVVKGYRPKVGTAFVTYLDLDATQAPEVELPPQFRDVLIDSSSHPLLPRFSPRWQRRIAGPRLDAGDWYAVAMLDDDHIFGHFWLTLRNGQGLFNGIPNLHLGADEAYGFDLYLDPDYRRGNMSLWAAKVTIDTLRSKGASIGYTHVLHDNPGSVLWHHGIGFNWVQVFNYLNVGPRIWWRIPMSESPRYGPLSRRGRHTEDDPQLPFGGQMLPQ